MKKVKITIPTSLADVKLKDYQRYIKIYNENKDAADFLNLKLVEIFCGLKLKDVNQIKVQDFEMILKDITEVFNGKPIFKQRFEFKGVEYGFIPKLDNIEMGEYIDLTNYIDDVDNWHKLMAVMYRPITYKKDDMYLIEDYEGSEKYDYIMRETPLDIILGAKVFFYRLAKELLKDSLYSFQVEATTNLQAKELLAKSGGGIHQFMHLLEEDWIDSIISPN